MIKVSVASKNPVKIECTRKAFKTVFPGGKFTFKGEKVSSGVSEQPVTDEETYMGAWNRANRLREMDPGSDYWVGIEGGIELIRGTMHAFAWMAVMNRGMRGEARTATFPIPERIRQLVDQGMELGYADDTVFKRENSKQKDGAVGILSHGIIDRSGYYEHALVLALIPFVNQELFSENGY